MGILRALTWTVPAVVATATAGTVATRDGVESDWYEKLDKPPFQPPPAVFPIAWTALYGAIAVASASVDGAIGDDVRETDRIGAEVAARELRRRRRRFRLALGVNLLLNAGWCWTFFASRRLPEGAVVAGALAASTVDLARRAGRERPAAGRALAVYAVWTAFAAVLSTAIWLRNPRA